MHPKFWDTGHTHHWPLEDTPHTLRRYTHSEWGKADCMHFSLPCEEFWNANWKMKTLPAFKHPNHSDTEVILSTS